MSHIASIAPVDLVLLLEITSIHLSQSISILFPKYTKISKMFKSLSHLCNLFFHWIFLIDYGNHLYWRSRIFLIILKSTFILPIIGFEI